MHPRWLLFWLAAVAVTIASIHGWVDLKVWMGENDELAAWVQAVGSVAAILATGWAVNHAHVLAQEERATEERRAYNQFLDFNFQVIGRAVQTAGRVREAVEQSKADGMKGRLTTDKLTGFVAQMSALNDAMQGMDLSRFDRFEFLECAIVARTNFPVFIADLRDVLENRISLSVYCDASELDQIAAKFETVMKPKGRVLLDALAARNWKVPRGYA